MKPGIHFKKIWFDNDVVELRIDSCDGVSLFSNQVYVGPQMLEDLIDGLNTFRNDVYGGLYDIALGAFGPEYARGAFHARLHFQTHSKIHITIKAQAEFAEFGMQHVASEAVLYLISEPVLLDNFIAELKALTGGSRDEAKLEAI